MAYTKLFSTIVTSSIWTEDDKTRIVWITMLAIADKNGEVQASIPGLARVAGVSVAATERAVARFLAPDPYSRTADDEGRRLEKIDGGWSLLNHSKYRNMASKDEQRTANAERQKRYREKVSRNASVTHSNGIVTDSNATVTHERDIAEAEAEAEADRSLILIDSPPNEPKATTKAPRGKNTGVSTFDTAEEIYRLYPLKVGKQDAIKAIKKALKERKPEELMEAAAAYRDAVARWPESEKDYIPHPSKWFNTGRYDDDRATWQRKGSKPPAPTQPKIQPIPAPENWQERWLAHPDEPGLDRSKGWHQYTPQEQARMAAKIAEVNLTTA